MHQHLTTHQKTKAYRAIVDRFCLRHQQRSALDAAPTFRAIRQAAHNRQWVLAEVLLHEAGIIFSERADA